MSSQNDGNGGFPGWIVISSDEELEEHDPHSPAFLEIPAALVRPVWEWLEKLANRGQEGEISRGLELLLVCLSEREKSGIASALNQMSTAIERVHSVVHRFVVVDPRSPDPWNIEIPTLDAEEEENGGGPVATSIAAVSAPTYPARSSSQPWCS